MAERIVRQPSLISIGLLLVCLLVWPFSPSQPVSAQGKSTTYSGRATVVQAAVLGLEPIVLSDTGNLDSTGGAKEASLLEAAVPGLLAAEVLHASTVGQGNHSRSEASVANVNLTVGGNTIDVDFLITRAEASCGPGGCSVSGSSEILGLIVNGQPIAVTGQPNQTLGLLGVGTVIINEQMVSQNGRTCDITVNALHVVIPGVADVIVSSAHADITCRKPVCPGGDFVTGGGWILTTSGAKANFAVGGGIKNGGFWGHLQYIDHGAGLKAKGTGVTGYEGTGTCRTIRGTCDINGAPGTYEVTACDNGEPGRNDTFTISLSNGYSAGGTLPGGNIQLHSPCK